MTPYVIINGKSSKQIDGLIVQSLPPITKPQMRTQLETVDGRDGDLVTQLGYSAYDKAFSIGLKGDYNVDDVAGFFNTSGRITFSNEIDKYYLFSQYAGIDFNRLLRFRTANVTVHVQPFKYSLIEGTIIATDNGKPTIDINVRNTGNIYSKPIFTITGKGQIDLYFNEVHKLKINLSNAGETIIIDTPGMNALSLSGDYLNRQVTGDYDEMRLPPGANVVSVAGMASEIKIDQYSRWI
jgi:phage-related protein